MSKYVVDLRKSGTKFSAHIRFIRFWWSYFFWPLVRFIPTKAGSLARVWMLRCFGARIGVGCLVELGVKVWIPWRLELADYVAIGRFVELYNYDWIKVGGMSVVSQYTYLCTGSHDYTHPYFPLIWRPITLGDQVWLAAKVFVAPGVFIGAGAVVGAGSVVVNNILPWTVNGGNPSRFIRARVVVAH